MRVYFGSRASIGWKGIDQRPVSGRQPIARGLRIARGCSSTSSRLGVGRRRILDVISPQYIGDLIAWGAIGARTTGNQVHRELASGIGAIGSRTAPTATSNDRRHSPHRITSFPGVHRTGRSR
jgi:3-deoxy-7-phosphoheptulonate synthase